MAARLVSRECTYEEYPELLKSTTTQTLQQLKERGAWRAGDTIRIVVHAFKPLKDVEVSETVAASVAELGREQNIEFAFLTVADSSPPRQNQ